MEAVEKQMKEIIIVLAVIVLLTGVVHSFRFSSFFGNFVVALAYLVGFLGLYLMWKSSRHKDEKKCYLTFFIGLATLMMAYFFLQSLLVKRYGGR